MVSDRHWGGAGDPGALDGASPSMNWPLLPGRGLRRRTAFEACLGGSLNSQLKPHGPVAQAVIFPYPLPGTQEGLEPIAQPGRVDHARALPWPCTS